MDAISDYRSMRRLKNLIQSVRSEFDPSVPSRRHEYLSKRLRWSVLAMIGRAPVMRLTVLVPLIGVMLIFNRETTQFLTLSPQFISDLGLPPDSAISFSNLYFTYFGLCFLGVGSAIFALYCPEEISRQPKQLEYLLNITSGETPVLAKANFQAVLEAYFNNCRDIERDFELPNAEYPNELEADFHNLMEAMYSATDFGEDEGGDIDFPEVMMPTGYLNFHSFAEMVYRSIAAEKIYWMPFRSVAPIFAKDIAYLKYKSDDYSKYRTRIVVTLFYFLGLIITLIPTVKTFLFLTISLISGLVFGG